MVFSRSTKYFEDEFVDEIMDIVTKKAEGGRVGLELGGTPKSLLLKWLMKQAPKLLNAPGKAADAYLKFLKDIKTKTLKSDYTKALDAGIIYGLVGLLGNQYKKWAYGTEPGSFGESEYPRYSAGNLYGQNDEYWEQLAKEKFEGINNWNKCESDLINKKILKQIKINEIIFQKMNCYNAVKFISMKLSKNPNYLGKLKKKI